MSIGEGPRSSEQELTGKLRIALVDAIISLSKRRLLRHE